MQKYSKKRFFMKFLCIIQNRSYIIDHSDHQIQMSFYNNKQRVNLSPSKENLEGKERCNQLAPTAEGNCHQSIKIEDFKAMREKSQENMLIKDQRLGRRNHKKAPQPKKTTTSENGYYSYQKSVKMQGESAQMRLKSKLNFILSGFREESVADSVSYYNQSVSRTSRRSSSQSIHSNESNPQQSKKKINQPLNKSERVDQTNKFEQISLVQPGRKDLSRKYLFYEEQLTPKKEKENNFQPVEQILHVRYVKQGVDHKKEEERVIFAQEAEEPEKRDEVPAAFQTLLIQKEKKLSNFVKTKEQIVKSRLEEISLLPVVNASYDFSKKRQNLLPKGVSKSISVNMESSQTPGISKISKNQRYNKEPSQKNEPNQHSNSVQMYQHKYLKQSVKNLIEVESSNEKQKNISSKFNKGSLKSKADERSEIQSLKLQRIENNQDYLSATNNFPSQNDDFTNDALQELMENDIKKVRMVSYEGNSSSRKEKSHLKTVEHGRDPQIQSINQFLPKNIVSFRVDEKRKLKSQLSERPEERKKMLALLKKREEALAQKVREQMRIGPKLFRLDSTSGPSKQSSMKSNDVQSPKKMPNNLLNNGKYIISSKTDRFKGPQKHIFFAHQERPHFPTEDLKYSRRQMHDPPNQTFNQNSEQYFPKVNHHNMMKYRRKSDFDQDYESSLNKHQSLIESGNKISYYNLNRFQREHKIGISNKNTSAKQKYDRLKRLLSQI